MNRLIFSVLLLSVSSTVFAKTIVESRPGVVSAVSISKDEFTLISIKDASIQRIDGENFIDNIEKDKGFGKAFIKPTTLFPFTIYVTDSKGRTFPLFIAPSKEAHGAVVEIVDVSLVQEFRGSDALVFGPKLTRIDHIKNLISAMYHDKRPNDMTVRVSRVDLDWWLESSFVMVREYEHREMVGYVFELTNTSGKQMILEDAEFQVRKAVAASIEKSVLNPGESTRVFVVTQNGEER